MKIVKTGEMIVSLRTETEETTTRCTGSNCPSIDGDTISCRRCPADSNNLNNWAEKLSYNELQDWWENQ